MRKWKTFLMTLLVGSSLSYANAEHGQVNFEAGYRCDSLTWHHRVPASDPFVKRTTRFKDIDIFQIGVDARATLGCNFYVRGNAYWGWILDGDFKEKITTYGSGSGYDYGFNDGGFTFSSQNRNVIDDKYVYGISAGIGYPFYFCDCSTILAPVIGYSFDEQNIHVDGAGFDRYSYDNFFIPRSGDDCCRHKHATRWYGPFVGLDFNYRPCGDCWDLYAQLEYHWGNFQGRKHQPGASWWDRDHFTSRAHGWLFAIGADYDIDDCWTVGLNVKFQNWKAHKHHHSDSSYGSSYFFSDSYYGSGSSGGHGRNSNDWRSYAINLTIGRHF